MSLVGNAGDAFLGDDFGKQGFGNDRADTNHKGKANHKVSDSQINVGMTAFETLTMNLYKTFMQYHRYEIFDLRSRQ